MSETLARRWERLKPTLEIVRPKGDGPFPVVLLFPGCGGVRSHLHRYAKAAAKAGWMAVTVESFKARGWTEAFVRTFVCSGLVLRGGARAGDVMAAATYAGSLADADPKRIAMAGWSHGGWAIMDLMTLPLDAPGGAEAGIDDPENADLSAVKGAFLAYPYIGWITASRHRDWKRRLDGLVVIPTRDHMAGRRQYDIVLGHARAGGAVLEEWLIDATHAYDEPGLTHPRIHHDPRATVKTIQRFVDWLKGLGQA